MTLSEHTTIVEKTIKKIINKSAQTNPELFTKICIRNNQDEGYIRRIMNLNPKKVHLFNS